MSATEKEEGCLMPYDTVVGDAQPSLGNPNTKGNEQEKARKKE